MSEKSHKDRGILVDAANIPAGLKRGQMTLASHQLYLQVVQGSAPLNKEEARRSGYAEDEIAAYFHPAAGSAP